MMKTSQATLNMKVEYCPHAKIDELELDYKKTIQILREEALLLEDSNSEFWRVTR